MLVRFQLETHGHGAELAYAYGSEPYPARVEGSSPSMLTSAKQLWGDEKGAGTTVPSRGRTKSQQRFMGDRVPPCPQKLLILVL